eukprot:65582-Rhodomonas_salina.1
MFSFAGSLPPMVLRLCYTVSGTYIDHAATRCAERDQENPLRVVWALSSHTNAADPRHSVFEPGQFRSLISDTYI